MFSAVIVGGVAMAVVEDLVEGVVDEVVDPESLVDVCRVVVGSE